MINLLLERVFFGNGSLVGFIDYALYFFELLIVFYLQIPFICVGGGHPCILLCDNWELAVVLLQALGVSSKDIATEGRLH